MPGRRYEDNQSHATRSPTPPPGANEANNEDWPPPPPSLDPHSRQPMTSIILKRRRSTQTFLPPIPSPVRSHHFARSRQPSLQTSATSLVPLPKKKPMTSRHVLPSLNWCVIKPPEVKGTIFDGLDEAEVVDVINFDEFEELFKKDDRVQSNAVSSPRKRKQVQGRISLLQHARQKQISCIIFNLKLSPEEIIQAVRNINFDVLCASKLEILEQMTPTADEIESYSQYSASGQSLEELSREDLFLFKLSRSQRLNTRVRVMLFISNFAERISIRIQYEAVLKASESLLKSRKFRRILRVILAYGNYMNGGKRGPVCGFKLESLTVLSSLRSTDRKISLLQYIVQTIHEKMPQLVDFDSELCWVQEAAAVQSLEGLDKEVKELDRGLETIHTELKHYREASQAKLLRFVRKAETKLQLLNSLAQEAQNAFRKCQHFFGESNARPNEFFGVLLNFIKDCKTLAKGK